MLYRVIILITASHTDEHPISVLDYMKGRKALGQKGSENLRAVGCEEGTVDSEKYLGLTLGRRQNLPC